MTALILIKNNTREILKNLGKKGQTYDQVIRELIETKHKLDSTESKSFRDPSIEFNRHRRNDP